MKTLKKGFLTNPGSRCWVAFSEKIKKSIVKAKALQGYVSSTQVSLPTHGHARTLSKAKGSEDDVRELKYHNLEECGELKRHNLEEPEALTWGFFLKSESFSG